MLCKSIWYPNTSSAIISEIYIPRSYTTPLKFVFLYVSVDFSFLLHTISGTLSNYFINFHTRIKYDTIKLCIPICACVFYFSAGTIICFPLCVKIANCYSPRPVPSSPLTAHCDRMMSLLIWINMPHWITTTQQIQIYVGSVLHA